MRLVHGYSDVPPELLGAVLALGNFDGVHRGHQALLAAARKVGAQAGKPTGALLFEPHPREFFAPAEPHFRLTSLEEKLDIFASLGLDVAVVLEFDADLAALDAETFVERVLVGALVVTHVVAGYHFFFGRGRSGTPETLRALGTRHGFGVSVVEPVGEAGEVFSSTAIRLHLAQGDVVGAARSLGRWWQVNGPVVDGAKRGRGLGFPTANIALRPGTALAHGIYAVRAHVQERDLEGVAYLGTRPMFDNGSPVLEVFLFDFDGDIYGADLTVQFIAFVRGDRKFADLDELKAQMTADCAEARRLLSAAKQGEWQS
jgi:riboflavin kinase / FMN adenylyltransferase